LGVVQHAERHASLEPERAHARDHVEHGVEFRTVADLAPGRPHAEAIGAGRLGAPRRGQHGCDLEHLDLAETDLAMMRRLRAIAAILGAAAGLDRQEARLLDVIHVVIGAMGGIGARDQIEERQIVDGADLGRGPVVAGGGFGGLSGHAWRFRTSSRIALNDSTRAAGLHEPRSARLPRMMSRSMTRAVRRRRAP
jgi:hypothetical protein